MLVLTNKFASVLLASMTHLISPGNTIFSQVPISLCDATCQETNLCENVNNWKCKKPQFSQELFDLYKEHYSEVESKLRSFTRPETFEEGIVRYAVISEAYANVSKKFTIDICVNRCSTDNICIEKCNSSPNQEYKRRELSILMEIVSNQESGFRADVQGGTGDYGRGDCQWQFADKKTAQPFTKGAKPIKSTCKSVCLGQIKIGQGATNHSWTADDLVGIDYASTERCLTTVAEYILKAEELCYSRYGKSKDWYKSIFAAYGSGTSCLIYKSRITTINESKIKEYAYMTSRGLLWGVLPPDDSLTKEPLEELWPAKRANIFGRFIGCDLKPTDEVINILKTADAQKLYATLMGAQHLSWLPAVDKPAAVAYNANPSR